MPVRDASASIEACLEPASMRMLLQQALPGFADGQVTIGRLRIMSARRSASRRHNPNPLTLRYELDVHDTATGTVGTRQFYGKVFRDGASAQAVHGTPALHLPQLDMLLWAWPADPGLPQLPYLLDPHQTRRWWGEPAHEVSALRYEPEQRATLRYTCITDGAEPRHLFAKTFSDDRGEAVHRRFAHFRDLARHDRLAHKLHSRSAIAPRPAHSGRSRLSVRRCCAHWHQRVRHRCPAGWRTRLPQCTPRRARWPDRSRTTTLTGSPKFAAGARKSPASRPNSPIA